MECLETGVYRSDIEYKFDMKPEGFQGLIDNIDRDMTFAIEVEGGIDRRKITNYDEVSRSQCSVLDLCDTKMLHWCLLFDPFLQCSLFIWFPGSSSNH